MSPNKTLFHRHYHYVPGHPSLSFTVEKEQQKDGFQFEASFAICAASDNFSREFGRVTSMYRLCSPDVTNEWRISGKCFDGETLAKALYKALVNDTSPSEYKYRAANILYSHYIREDEWENFENV